MTTLTDRYVHAVLRSLPERQREEIDRELRATIADDIDARIADGAPAKYAERAALTELGHPARLAAGYVGRPLTLIGPAFYVSYVRLLKLLLAIVLPAAAFGVSLGKVLDGSGIGEIIGTVVVVELHVVVHLGFWVTLVFVILERSGATDVVSDFDPDALPDLPAPGRVGVSELVASVSFLALFAVAIVLQQFVSVFEDANGPIPILDPALWSLWTPWFLAIIVLEIVFAVALFRAGRWTWPLAVANILLGAAFVIPAVRLLATGELLNPAYFAEFGGTAWIEPSAPTIIVIAVVVVAIAVWDAVDGIIKTVRAGRPA